MVASARSRTVSSRWLAVTLSLLAAAPLVGADTIFNDNFESMECSLWSATSNPVAYPDLDADLYGDESMPTVYCQLPEGYVFTGGDCDDDSSAINPDATEVCDGADNDCNVLTLDGDDEAWLGGACDGTDSDLCTDGMYVCASASQYCSDSGEENLEVCNGADDDCDSFIDEDFACVELDVEQCGVSDVGECKYGTRVCSAECSWGECSGNVDPVSEICDGKDNNCDGVFDEGDPGGGADCDTGNAGICSVGIMHCVAGELSCIQQHEADPDETCGDGLDNDCNGMIDDGCD